MAYVVELGCFNPATNAETTVRFAYGLGVALTDVPWIPPGLSQWLSPSQKLQLGADGPLQISTTAGQVDIANIAPTINDPGPYDSLVGLVFQGRAATLYSVTTTWAARVAMAVAVVQQPKAVTSVDNVASSLLTFSLVDPRLIFSGPLQATKYAGTNSNGMGVEGDGDLAGKTKPIIYGRVSNIPGVLVNQGQYIYQLADAPAYVDCVRDGGNALLANVARGSLASMQANFPPGGMFDTYSGPEGTFVKIATKPVGSLTFDAYEGLNITDRTHAQIWARLHAARCGTASNRISTGNVDTLDGAEAGFYWQADETQLDALNEVLSSCSGYEVQRDDGTWVANKLVLPVDSAGVATLRILTPTAIFDQQSRKLRTAVMVQPDYMPDGSLVCVVNMEWGRNYTVMSAGDFVGVAVARLQAKFQIEYRTATAAAPAIWDPVALTGPWKNAPQMTIPTGYAVGPDGLTCPGAQAEANRILALYTAWRSAWQVTYDPKVGDRVLAGDVVAMQIPQMLGNVRRLFRVLQTGFHLSSQTGDTPIAEIVMGLQT